MDKLVYFLIPIGLAATLLVLCVGIYSLAKGGAFSRQHSNRLMWLRVVAQAITIGLMMLFLALIGRGPGS